jgi:hypothetical protein
MWLLTMAMTGRMPCPTNDKIAAAIGARSAAAGAAALKRLEASGQITIERANGWRIIRHPEFGSKTEGPDE